jgi:AAA15 family ATPase/GTPase
LKNLTEEKLQDSYGYIQLSENETLLNNYLNKFDNKIKEFKFIDGKPMLKTDKWIYLNEFGDGIKSFIFMVCGLFKSTNGYLFIDEIENGIWYQKFSLVWEVIENLSNKLNVQVFVTTHSKEIVEKTINIKNISLVELFKRKENIKNILLDKEMLVSELEQEHEIRRG